MIVCSRDAKALKALLENIEQTVGVPYEIIPIDNASGAFGICEAYNTGAQKSRFDCLCFVHEDVSFSTLNWGHKLLEIVANPTIGLVGVAGATHKSANVSAWWDIPLPYQRMHLVQPQEQQLTSISLNPQQETLAEVVAVDGVFLATKKNVWEQFKFDQKTLKGFHFYDVDFSTAIRTRYKVVVTYEILLTHYSAGSPDTVSWVEHAVAYHRKWKKCLPDSVSKKNVKSKFLLEKIAGFNIILRSKNVGYPITSLAKDTIRYVRFPYKLVWFVAYFSLVAKGRLKTKR